MRHKAPPLHKALQLAASCALSSAATFTSMHTNADPLQQSKSHDISLSSRTRISSLENTFYENDEAQSNTGKAMSARVQLNIESQWTKHWYSHIELEHIERTWKADHSDGVDINGKPTIPDTENSGIIQLHLSYQSRDLNVAIGRKALNFDNERFIGSISFWQHEQTFELLHLRWQVFSNSAFQYSHLNKAHRIFGDDAGKSLSPGDINYAALDGQRPLGRLGEHNLNSHLWQFDFTEWDYHELSLFSYHMKNETAKALSNLTTGGRYKFNYKQTYLKYRVELAAAHQERTQLANAIDTQYYSLELGAGRKSIEMTAHYEILSANIRDGQLTSFITPLASLHEHQGWADHFSITPAKGIKDMSLGISWRKAPWKLQIRKHVFYEDKGSKPYGRELDIDLRYKITNHQSVHLRSAYFSDSRDYRDTYPDRKRIFLSYSVSLP